MFSEIIPSDKEIHKSDKRLYTFYNNRLGTTKIICYLIQKKKIMFILKYEASIVLLFLIQLIQCHDVAS